MTLTELNSLTADEAKKALYLCCSASHWSAALANQRPFKSLDDLLVKADLLWLNASAEDSKEAFSHHPRIGGNLQALKDKFQSTKSWASQEQSGVKNASDETLKELSDLNSEYEKRFGFVFLICATGKSAAEMLDVLKLRIKNTPGQEFQNARIEQGKITAIRLKKLLEVTL